MAKPTKPSNVKVSQLNDVLSDLQALQKLLANPRPGGWDSIGTTIETDLKQGDKGLQTNIANTVGNRYADNVYYINQAHQSLKSGVDTLVKLVSQTVAKHQNADDDAANGANKTNTGSPSSSSGASNYGGEDK